MNHSDKDTQQQVSLEELLQLKRHEKPKAEFWDKFDRQLKAKQLQAIVGHQAPVKRFMLRFKSWWALSLPLTGAAAFAAAVAFSLDAFQASPISQKTTISARTQSLGQIDAPTDAPANYVTGELPEPLEIEPREYTQVASTNVVPSNNKPHVQFVASTLGPSHSHIGFY